MDFYIYLFFSALWLGIGLALGYYWRKWEERCQQVEATAGAAYDACEDEPHTDHDARAYDLLKKNGLLT